MSKASSSRGNGREARTFPQLLLSVTGKESKLPGGDGGFLGACRPVENFVKGNKVGEGTYGVVYRVADTHDGQQYAVKRIRMDNDNDGFPIPSIREVSLLNKLRHRNVVCVKEVVVGDTLDKIFMLMEFADTDLAALLDRLPQPLGDAEVKCLMRQLLEGMSYLHNNFVMHRDLKLANLLLNREGVLKIADFGLARKFGVPLKPITPKVVTLWYRAPELLLGERVYSVAIDNWSIGCILGELLLNKPLLPGKTDIEQINIICDLIGTPQDRTWPDWRKLPNAAMLNTTRSRSNMMRSKFLSVSGAAFDLLQGFLTYNPATRITCAKALRLKYLSDGSVVLLSNPHIKAHMKTSQEKSIELAKLTERRQLEDTVERGSERGKRRRQS